MPDKKETMKLKTAAEKYDIRIQTLQNMCLRGLLKSVRVGKFYYVTTAEMDRVFKGEVVV